MGNVFRGRNGSVSEHSMEADLRNLLISLKGEKELVEWMEKSYSNGGHEIAINELRRKGFRYLGTLEGWDFLIKKYPCPNAVRKDH